MSHPIPRELLRTSITLLLATIPSCFRQSHVQAPFVYAVCKGLRLVRIYVPISVQRNFNAAFNVVRLLRSVTRKKIDYSRSAKRFSFVLCFLGTDSDNVDPETRRVPTVATLYFR